MFKLEKEEALYPKICVCVYGETEKSNYSKILKSFFDIISKDDKEKIGITYLNPIKFAFHSYSDDLFYESKKIGYESKIWISDVKENYKNGISYLEKKSQELKKDKEKVKKIKYILKQQKISQKNNYPKKNICRLFLSTRLYIFKKLPFESIEKGDFIDEFTDIYNLLDIFKKFKIKINGHTCNSLIFDSKKYAILGNFKLPFALYEIPDVKNIPFASELIKQMGEPELELISFKINNSPLGLENIALSVKGNNYIVPIKFNYKTNSLDDLIKKNYLQTINIAKIIMRKIK